MKCIELGLRPPDGLFLAYVPVLVAPAPSPGRLICLMDPLLPFGFLMGCLKGILCNKRMTLVICLLKSFLAVVKPNYNRLIRAEG